MAGIEEDGQQTKLTFARLSICADLITTLTVTRRPCWSHRTAFLTTHERAVGYKHWRGTKEARGKLVRFRSNMHGKSMYEGGTSFINLSFMLLTLLLIQKHCMSGCNRRCICAKFCNNPFNVPL